MRHMQLVRSSAPAHRAVGSRAKGTTRAALVLASAGLAALLVGGCGSSAPTPTFGQVGVDGGGLIDSGSADACTGAGCGGSQTCIQRPDGTCVDCTTDVDCPTGVCEPTSHTCVACLTDADCGAQGVCHPARLTCVACASDSDCPDGVCSADNTCVECVQGDQCPSGLCDEATHTCAPACTADAGCDDGDPCTNDACKDGVCTFTFAPDGTACDDGDDCTAGDVCTDGQCAGEAVPGPGCGTICPAMELACPDGAQPVDTTGDGCEDGCECVSSSCVPCDGDPACTVNDECIVGQCVLGVCEFHTDPTCCPELGCQPPLVATDTGGDACPDACLCPDGSEPTPGGTCAGSTKKSLCEETGGTWDPTSCGDYDCGEVPPCAAVIPGCDCGPDANFVPLQGCQPDPTCAPCAPLACDSDLAPFDTDGDGCEDTCLCPNGSQPIAGVCAGTSPKQAICENTGGTWVPTACGDYVCGVPNDCTALDPGCDCGPTKNYMPFLGCQPNSDCQPCQPIACAAPTQPVDTNFDGCADTCLCPDGSKPTDAGVCCDPPPSCAWDELPQDTNDDGCADTCLCVDGSQPGPDGCTGSAADKQLCKLTGGTWDPNACGDYICGQPQLCDALIPGCDCGPDANFVDYQGCVEDPACAGECPPLNCGPGQFEIDVGGDGCADFCSADCQSACDCYDVGLTFPEPCNLLCPNCGNYWSCEPGTASEPGMCYPQCGPFPDEVLQCMDGTQGG